MKGPGAYFQQPPTEMASSMSTDFTATAPARWKSPKTFNIDPMSPSASFHSLSWRHERATTPENDPSECVYELDSCNAINYATIEFILV